MKKRWTLNNGIGFGIALMLLLIVAVGAVGFAALNRVLSAMELHRAIQALVAEAAAVRGQVDRFELSALRDDFASGDRAAEAVASGLDRARSGLDALARRAAFSGRDGETAEIRTLLESYGAVFAEYRSMSERERELRAAVEAVFPPVLQEIS